MKWIVLIASLFFAVGAKASTREANRVLAAEKKRYDAMIKGDTTALSSMIAPSVKYIHSNGLVDSKKSFLQSIISGALQHKAITIEQNEVRIYQRKTAIVTGQCTYDIVYEGKAMTLHFVFCNVYTRLKGEWILINRQTTKIA